MKLGLTVKPTDEERAELEHKRKLLLQRLDAIKEDFANGLNSDSSERAVELENAEVLNEIVRVTEEELAAVDTRLSQV